MAGYIRQDTTNNIADGNVINASDFDNEYNAIEAAFHASTGHTHDGTSAEGAPITKVGPAQDLVISTGSALPKTNNTMDLGSNSFKFKDVYAAGTAYIATLDLTNALAVADGGTGAATFTANNVLLGNGTSAFQTVAPGSSGNILTSNGTTWTSAAPAVTLAGNNAFTGANTFYNATGQTFGTATSTQDGIIVAGRAGGSSSYRVTLTPTTLTASRTLTLPDVSTTVVGTDATQTLTNKRIDPRVVSATSASSLTPDVSVADMYAYTALAEALTINAPTGTPVNGTKLMFRLLDNGTARALTWNGTYTAIGVTLPTTTVINKTTYVGCVYNAAATRWDVVAVTTQA